MTDYAQGALGDVVFAQLPEPDSELNQMGISLFGNGISSTISRTCVSFVFQMTVELWKVSKLPVNSTAQSVEPS